jgi:hypothetical protein
MGSCPPQRDLRADLWRPTETETRLFNDPRPLRNEGGPRFIEGLGLLK